MCASVCVCVLCACQSVYVCVCDVSCVCVCCRSPELEPASLEKGLFDAVKRGNLRKVCVFVCVCVPAPA